MEFGYFAYRPITGAQEKYMFLWATSFEKKNTKIQNWVRKLVDKKKIYELFLFVCKKEKEKF